MKFAVLGLLLTLLISQPSWASEHSNTTAPPNKRVIHIAADYNYPPYEFVDNEGNPAGYTVELSHAIAEVMGFEIKLTMTDWKSAYAGLLDGSYDMLQGIAYSDERAEHIRFSSPHSIVSQSLFARKDGPHVADISETAGHEVVVQNASIMHEYLKQEVPDAIIIPVATHSDALRLVASGKHDFALTANSPSLYLSKELDLSNIEPIARPVAGQRLSYGALPENEDLVALFSEGLAILRNTGRQQAIYDKWLGTLDNSSKVPLKKLGQYAFYTILLLLLILGASMIWNSMLRKEVEKRSRLLKAHQEQLVQADKMASLGVLVSGVAHEINNPTGLLMLNLPILKSAWEDALPYLDRLDEEEGLVLGGLSYQRLKGEMPHLMEEMQHSTDKIRNIVNDLKDFSREQPEAIRQEVELNSVVATAVRLVDKSIRNSTENFHLELDPREPKILGNPQRIEQVVINLILNACDALTDKEASLTVSTVLSNLYSQALIVVEDTGCGIEAKALSRLTEPFYTTKRESGGTGLGLSVSAGIIKAHKGRLTFTSQVGEGTTASVVFPLYKSSTSA